MSVYRWSPETDFDAALIEAWVARRSWPVRVWTVVRRWLRGR